jgi:hypothetical protein
MGWERVEERRRAGGRGLVFLPFPLCVPPLPPLFSHPPLLPLLILPSPLPHHPPIFFSPLPSLSSLPCSRSTGFSTHRPSGSPTCSSTRPTCASCPSGRWALCAARPSGGEVCVCACVRACADAPFSQTALLHPPTLIPLASRNPCFLKPSLAHLCSQGWGQGGRRGRAHGGHALGHAGEGEGNGFCAV